MKDWKEAIENPREHRAVQEEHDLLRRVMEDTPLDVLLLKSGTAGAMLLRLELLRRERDAAWRVWGDESDKRLAEERKQRKENPPEHPTDDEITEAKAAMARRIPGLAVHFEDNRAHGWLGFGAADWEDETFWPKYVAFYFNDDGGVTVGDSFDGLEGVFESVTAAVEAYAQNILAGAAKAEAMVDTTEGPGTGWEFIGTWPGDETEEELLEMLKEGE